MKCTKKNIEFCELCAHFLVDTWYYKYRKNPPIHYIVFATPHKKKYLLQKRQLNQLPFLLPKNKDGLRRKQIYMLAGWDKLR